MDIFSKAGAFVKGLGKTALAKLEAEGNEILVAVAEDGSKFFTMGEAKVHEDLLYIGKTIAAYGHEEVTSAIAEVSKLYPSMKDAISAVAQRLQWMHTGKVITPEMPKIDSVNAPATVAVDLSSGEAATEIAARIAETKTTEAPQTEAPPPPAQVPPVAPPPPSEPERVQKPDVTPRGDVAASAGPAAVAAALGGTDAVPPVPSAEDSVEAMRRIVEGGAPAA